MPSERLTIDELLEQARRRLARVEPEQARAAVDEGALLVDIRSDVQREADGTIPGALFHRRNVLEWRADPTSTAAHPVASDRSRRLVLLCAEGYQSSLAAATLQDLGCADATDVVDGFEGWRAAGLPVEPFDPERDGREGSSA